MTGIIGVSVLVLSVISLAGVVSAQSPGRAVFYPVPDAVTDSPYVVEVDGKPLPIEKAGAYSGAYYARFEFDGKVRVSVRVKATAATSMDLKPERFRTNMSKGTATLSFDVDTPGPRVLPVVCGSKDIWPIIIFAEPIRDWSKPAGAIDISDHISGDGPHTASIQNVLDDCSRRGGGTVYFGPGIYDTGALRIGDNTTVLLAPGCLIRGSTDINEYATQFGQKDLGSNSPGFRSNGLINFINSKNSGIRGPGVIEGMGHLLRDEYDHNGRALKIVSSEKIVVEDVILRNAPSWTCQIFDSRDVVADRVKVVADWAVGNTDGINPDCSQDVTISNFFGFCGDDAVAIKATSGSDLVQGSRNIRVSDAIVMTRKTGFKIGTETLKDISDVLFERCEAVNSSRGIGIYLNDGHTVSNIAYRDMRFDLKEYPGEGASGEPFTLAIGNRTGIGRMSDITFERVHVSAPCSSNIAGRPESQITNVTFRDCVMEVRDRAMKMYAMPVFDLRECRNFQFSNFKLQWNTRLNEVWDGFMKQLECENVVVEGLEETRPE